MFFLAFYDKEMLLQEGLIVKRSEKCNYLRAFMRTFVNDLRSDNGIINEENGEWIFLCGIRSVFCSKGKNIPFLGKEFPLKLTVWLCYNYYGKTNHEKEQNCCVNL